MSAAGKIDDGGFSLVSEPSKVHGGFTAGPSNDDTGGFAIVSEPETSFLGSIARGIENAPTALKGALGGALQAIGQTPAQPNIITGPNDAQFPDDGPMKEAAELSVTQPGTPAYIGRHLFDSAAHDLKANAPHVEPGSLKDYAYRTSLGITEMLPALGLSMVAKNPVPAAAVIAGQSYGETYGSATGEGARSPDQAGIDAGFSAIVNGSMAMLPLHVLMKPGGTFLGKALQTAGATAFQGVATEAIQMGYDKGVIGKDVTAGEAVQRLKDAGIIGAVTGAFLGGGFHGLERLTGQAPAAAERTAPPEPPPRPAALDALQTTAEAPATDIMSADTVDDAIAKASAAVDHPALDVEAMGAEAKRQGEEADAEPLSAPETVGLKTTENNGIDISAEPEVADQSPSLADTTTLQGRVRGMRRNTGQDGPSDVASFLAARGGIRNDESHDLVAGRGLQQFVPGHGPLIRPDGMSIDAAGERLHEAGFFGPPEAIDRPTEDQVLQLLEQTGRGPDGKPTKVYAPEDQDQGDQAKRQAARVQEENDAALAEVHGIARQMGETLTEEDAHQILSEMGAHGLDPESALVEHLERQAVREDYSDHEGFTDPETQAEPVPFPEGGVDRAAGEVFDEPQPIAGDQGVTGEAGPTDAPHPSEALPSLTTERGAEGFDQTIIPGGEQSARQLAQAREAQGHGRATTTARQKPVDEGLFGEGTDDDPTMFSKREDDIAPPFFSALTRGVEGLKMEKATPGQWEATIKNMPGVKAEELDWSGVNDWLRGQTRSVTKAEVLDHLRGNEVQVQDVGKGTPRKPSGGDINAVVQWAQENVPHKRDVIDTAAMAAATGNKDGLRFLQEADVPTRLLFPFEEQFVFPGDNAKFGTYVLPGGKNYRELLLTLPHKFPEKLGDYRKPYTSGHFDEPNILAHVRFDDRTGPNGEKVLHVAEVQSDWHQAGRRKGYDTPLQTEAVHTGDPNNPFNGGEIITRQAGVPDAPFKTSWHELAMKRMLRYAAEHGYDRVSWDTGETQAARYDLSKQVSRIDAEKRADGNFGVEIFGKDGKPVGYRKSYTPVELAEHVGKDLADKIAKDLTEPGAEKSYKGLDLKVGGDGMKGFYDRILPNFLNKYSKKWGAKVEPSIIKGGMVPDDVVERIAKEDPDSDLVKRHRTPVHSIAITPAMRESVMQGQTLFQKGAEGDGKAPTRIRAGYSEEFAAQRDAVAADARKRLDALGLHDIGAKVADWIRAEHPDGNFAVNGLFRGAEKIIALALDSTNGLSTLDHEAIHAFRGLGLFKKSEWSMLANRATREWREKFDIDRRYAGRSEDKLNEEAIAEAFRHWVADPGTQKGLFARLFDRVRNTLAAVGNALRGRGFATPESIFRKADAGKIGARPRKPGNGSSVPAYAVRNAEQAEKETGPGEEPRGSWRGHIPDLIQEKAAPVLDVWHDLQKLTAPMATGSDTARAIMKDFANVMRLARWQGGKMDEFLQKHFNRAQQTRMWQAADAESVAVQRGENEAPAAGLSSLSDEERGVVERLQADAKAAFNAAKAQGMVEGEGLPSYAPRMIVEITRDGARPVGSTGAPASIPGLGRNLRTTTGNLRERKYLTTEETAAAATAKFGANAQVVQNIRTLPLATARLNEAVAGRAMINKIKAIGQSTGQETVVEGSIPEGEEHSWFTVDHPAFKTWRPRFETDKATGKTVPMKDANGEPIFEKVPIYVRSDFEGPLKAVLSEKSGAVYTGLMTLKGRVMSMIMYSPLIHNAVEWGRALPAMPGKVTSFKIYFEGNAAKNDHATMSEAINAGLVPIGHRYGFQDISSIAEEPNIAPGRSWTAKLLGAIPNLFDERAGDAVKSAVDKMGDIWHNTLLWDRVADLQMGLYTNFRQELIKDGNDPLTAQRIAAHFANRYAGALPLESMSAASRKLANLTLFSRTFTLGNLGAMKDAFLGLPKDVQAQIARDAGTASLKAGKSLARRRAIGVIALDIAFFYAGNSVLQSALNVMRGQNTASEEEQGYLDRLHDAMGRIEENPLELLSPFQLTQSLSATAENEPGNEDRIRVGTNDDGTAIYARNPAGKMGEEFHGWLTDPLDMIKRKLGTVAAPTLQLIANDKGFGRQVYDPKASSIGGALRNIGNIAMLYIDSQFPVDSAQAVVDMAHGRETKTNAFKAAGPLAGVTFSKGAPGGPAVGELYAEQERLRFDQQQAMPTIRRKIQDGDIDGAAADMFALGMSRGLVAYYIRTTENPSTRLSRKAMQSFVRGATPEETARMEAAQAQAQH